VTNLVLSSEIPRALLLSFPARSVSTFELIETAGAELARSHSAAPRDIHGYDQR